MLKVNFRNIPWEDCDALVSFNCEKYKQLETELTEKVTVVGTIVASEIVIVLEDKEGPYKNPTSVAGGGTGVHTLSYFPLLSNKELPDYETKLKSVKINNEEILTNTPGEGKSYKAENFDEEGTIILRTGGSFNFSIKLTKITNKRAKIPQFGVEYKYVNNVFL